MYFLKDMTRIVRVEPMYLGPEFHKHVEGKLKADIEGKCDSSGYYLCVTQIKKFESGRCQDGTGMVVIPVRFTVLVFQVIPFEVLDAVVSEINHLGIFCLCGPLQVFLSAQHLPAWEYNDVGVPKFVSSNSSAILEEGVICKVRVFAVNPEGEWLKGVGQLEGVN